MGILPRRDSANLLINQIHDTMTVLNGGGSPDSASNEIQSKPSGASTTSEHLQDPVAVVGLACRLPGNCNSPSSFWDFISRGGCADNEPPSSRFNFRGHFDGSRSHVQ